MPQAFKVSFELASCMQIGSGSLGMIEKTSLFIPKRIIWATLTRTFTIMNYTNPTNIDYVKVGEEFEKLSISTFFPFLKDILWVPFLPEQKFLNFYNSTQTLSFNEMEASALTSVTTTALNPESMTSKENTLHAVDLIKPFFDERNDLNSKLKARLPFGFSGFIEIPDDFPIPLSDAKIIEKTMTNSSFGGGRRYGWGHVKHVTVSSVPCFPQNAVRFPYNGGEVILDYETPISKCSDACGEPCLLSSRIFSETKGPGHDFTNPTLVWTPGTFIDKESRSPFAL